MILACLYKTSMSCIYERGQTGWGMFTTSTSMNQKN